MKKFFLQGKKMKALLFSVAAAAGILTGVDHLSSQKETQTVQAAAAYDKTLYFPLSRYPETGDHIRDAIEAGHSAICTIDRDGADQRREESLAGYPAKTGYDRDEWPMAMCEEGGYGADIRYISPSDNRGAGAWVGNQAENDPDGTRVLFIVQ
ncbi:NucA/NucB deoxyribonuclease domain-containing protein [Fictibacillus terranigra]|uniref:NucA/NucB deoxyribonuclease domain-containing protein n=1 Tax=Fictibacillus terranigra TaxID=3058424 RepID=A0ABT8E7Z4_9BACL|nr:NucA/NucB deoxyribonuclease domain-containing protein [Fictibacillus sp. CENA-BCM004]MDN4074020.1 NucA/NucB deoxyribonuclease domain-containing protein [Fictibacillus sp. CENA-BCM004]